MNLESGRPGRLRMPTPLPNRSAAGRGHLHWRPSGPRSGRRQRTLPAECIAATRTRNVSRHSSERLPDTEREIQMTGTLKSKLPGMLPVHCVGHNIGKAWEKRWIQIVSEVQTQRADGCLITHPDADGVREIVVVARPARELSANFGMGLVPAPQAAHHLLRAGE